MDKQKAKVEKEQKPALEEDTTHAVVVNRPEPAESSEIRKKKSEPPQDILILENGNIIIN